LMQPNIQDLIDWAREAGEILRAGYEHQHEVHYKGQTNPVTEIDKRSEDLLIGRIRERFSDHTIVTEESGLLRGTNEHTWYVDPLDGTVNYAHGVPLFVVSLAYAEHGQVQLGVVYEPMRDECFSAIRGQGARLNGRPIHVSDAHEMITSLLVTGFRYDLDHVDGDLDAFVRLSYLTQGVRRMGSAALDMAYVSAGRLDAFWEFSLEAWDIAAGSLLVEEAGGVVTTAQGEREILKAPYSVLCANSTLHPQVLKALQG